MEVDCLKNTRSGRRDKKSSQYGWVATVFCIAVALSAALSLASESLMAGAGMAVALLILALFIGLGILFDIIGVAVTAADEKPFHSMAAHREKGARDLTLEVRSGNETAINLYKAYGFKREAVRRGYYRDPKEDAWIMWLRSLPGTPS